jgi:UDP-N-acetyl-D-glucosamine dehydrogenase
LILPILERTGLRVGEDFFLAYSPERVDAGYPQYNSRNIPKVISGLTPRCTRLAALFYAQFIETVIAVSSPETAEMVKLVENTFRSVNVALTNEMALLSEKLNIDIWEVIEAAKTKPFEFMAFYPGPGLGKHCILYDPHYLTRNGRMDGFRPRLSELATDLNSQMPTLTIERIASALNGRQMSLKGSKILILGVTYKRDTSDLGESTAIEIMRGLRQKGASICYSDPYVAASDIDGETITSLDVTAAVLEAVDCAVLLTDHSDFDYDMIAAHSALVVDSRNAFKNRQGANIVRL